MFGSRGSALHELQARRQQCPHRLPCCCVHRAAPMWPAPLLAGSRLAAAGRFRSGGQAGGLGAGREHACSPGRGVVVSVRRCRQSRAPGLQGSQHAPRSRPAGRCRRKVAPPKVAVQPLSPQPTHPPTLAASRPAPQTYHIFYILFLAAGRPPTQNPPFPPRPALPPGTTTLTTSCAGCSRA